MGCENRCCVRKCFLGKVLSAERGNCCGLRILDWGMRRRRKRDNGDLTRNLSLVVLRRQGSDSILPIGEKCVAPLVDGQGFDGFLAKRKVVQVRRRIQVANVRRCAVDVGVGLLVTQKCFLPVGYRRRFVCRPEYPAVGIGLPANLRDSRMFSKIAQSIFSNCLRAFAVNRQKEPSGIWFSGLDSISRRRATSSAFVNPVSLRILVSD